jgi:lipopolysaccharide/colanic/teichoic acid biosynthesis glycosyltransferase
LQKVLSEEQVQDIVRRETSRADRTGRRFSIVLFEVQSADRRWSVSTCRMAKTLLSRVRQTDDVGWFDERHLCAVLADTPAAGARVFAARTCDAIAECQPRPLSIVYGYPSKPAEEEVEELSEHRTRLRITRHAEGHNGNGGRRNGNGPSHARRAESSLNGGDDSDAGGGTALALAEPMDEERGLPEADRERLVGYFLDGVSSGAKRVKKNSKPDVALEDLFVTPMPAWKRALDVVGAAFGLVVLSPLLGAAAVAIKLTDPSGPVIFTQKRSGLGGKPFTIFKFRTMCVDAERKQAALRAQSEQDGPAVKLNRDPRVTKVGQLLRKTSIDELPQLFNVLKGDMSLVGPRPLPTREQDGCTQWQRHRLNVMPGLTCIWQVDGRSEVSFDEWVRMDVKYMRRQSIWHDLSILFRTVPAVLLRRGAK